jgi:hypothetical protein
MVQKFTLAIKCRFHYVVQGIGSGTYETEYEGKKCTVLDGVIKCNIKKVKQSHYRPGQVPRVPEGLGSQISRQSAHDDCKVFSPMHRPLLPHSKYPWYSFLLEAE